MACSITKGRNLLPCKDAVSGIKNIYIFRYVEEDAVSITAVSTSTEGHIVTNMGNVVTAGYANEIYKYKLKNDGNTFNEDSASNSQNGTTMYTQVLNVVTTKISKDMQFQTKMLALGYYSVVIEDNNGTMYLLGKDLGAEVQVKSSIGGTMDAFSGYNLVFTAKELNPVYLLSETAATAVRAEASSATVDDVNIN